MTSPDAAALASSRGILSPPSPQRIGLSLAGSILLHTTLLAAALAIAGRTIRPQPAEPEGVAMVFETMAPATLSTAAPALAPQSADALPVAERPPRADPVEPPPTPPTSVVPTPSAEPLPAPPLPLPPPPPVAQPPLGHRQLAPRLVSRVPQEQSRAAEPMHPTNAQAEASSSNEATSKPAMPPAAAASVISQSWQGAIGAWLEAHKTYPEEARRRGDHGRAIVRFTVDRDGHVLTVQLMTGTGSASLDDAVERLLRGARLPPFPTDMVEPSVTVTLQIRYTLEQ
jgi:periplasmic protein TonB